MKRRKTRMAKAAFRSWMQNLCNKILRECIEQIISRYRSAIAAEATRMDSQIKYGTDTPPKDKP